MKEVNLLRFSPLLTHDVSFDPQLAYGILVLVALFTIDDQRLERMVDRFGAIDAISGDDVILEGLLGLAHLLQCPGVHLGIMNTPDGHGLCEQRKNKQVQATLQVPAQTGTPGARSPLPTQHVAAPFETIYTTQLERRRHLNGCRRLSIPVFACAQKIRKAGGYRKLRTVKQNNKNTQAHHTSVEQQQCGCDLWQY